MMDNLHLLLHRRAPALAGQRVCGGVPQGPFLPPVGVHGGPAAVAQGARAPDPEDPGRPVRPAARRGEAGSAHCRRKVGTRTHGGACTGMYLLCVSFCRTHIVNIFTPAECGALRGGLLPCYL